MSSVLKGFSCLAAMVFARTSPPVPVRVHGGEWNVPVGEEECPRVEETRLARSTW